MISRRLGNRVAKAVGAVSCQRRYLDHERWYGHALELDANNYRFTNELPEWARKKNKPDTEIQDCVTALGQIDFATSYEMVLYDADRLNLTLNRKEFGNELKFRLEKQANTIARGQQIVKTGTHANELKVEDTMIARVADEEHIQAEMKYVKCIRANEMAEDNRLDILPGGTPNSLREKTRWNISMELHPIDRSEIATRLTAWLPEKYHIVYFDDFQTVAANDDKARTEMFSIVEMVDKEHQDEAKATGYEQDLKDIVRELKDDIDPTREITEKTIADSTSLDQLEQWSRAIHEYNGDSRLFRIYERAATLTGNKEHQQLLHEIQELYAKRNNGF